MITTKTGRDDDFAYTFAQAQGERKSQQDAFGSAEADFFLIADGIGGAPYGDIAAKMAIERGLFAFNILGKRRFYWEAKEHLLNQVFRAVSRGLFKKNKDYPGFGTTLVAMCFSKKRWFVASVGDSRIYLLRDGKLTQLTKDHVDNTGRLTRWIPMEKFTKTDITSDDLLPGDAFLITSDGLFHALSERNIQETLQSMEAFEEKLKEKAETLVSQAIKKEGSDNVTICIVKKL